MPKHNEADFEITPELDNNELKWYWQQQAADLRQQIAVLHARLIDAEVQIATLEALAEPGKLAESTKP